LDGWKHRDQVDESILEVEASNHLLSALAEHYSHSHHNVRLFDESGKRSFRKYDALIHGHEIISPSIGFLIEGKYVPHIPSDIDNLQAGHAERAAARHGLPAPVPYPKSGPCYGGETLSICEYGRVRCQGCAAGRRTRLLPQENDHLTSTIHRK